jgi:exoribonuclease R
MATDTASAAARGRHVSFSGDPQYPPGESAPSPDESCMQPACEVVAVITRALARKLVVGVAVPPSSPGDSFLLRPLDIRLPPFVIDAAALPDLLSSASCSVQSALLSATFSDWDPSESRPRAVLQAALGEAGAIATETAAILAMHGVGSPEFEQDVIDCLPEHPYVMPESEIKARKDCRFERMVAAPPPPPRRCSQRVLWRRALVVVSIDPSTARDLDDALHVEVFARA